MMPLVPRDASLRQLYLSAALAEIPRLLGAIDRNAFRPTYGCLDRQYWHYRTSSFPSEMYQEGTLALAMVVRLPLPGNRWHADPRVRDLAVAALRFSARSSHADGSCDDYYPFERALGAAVFSLQAAARAVELLGLDDPEIFAWLRRRADWLAGHQESGRLANHQALAALGLLRVAQLTGQSRYQEAAQMAIGRVLQWQSSEGWFEEYGGADPGYQTVTIDCLAKIRQATGDHRLDEPLGRAVDFARHFLHPDQSYGGEYGSRGTYHFYPHGLELLAAAHPAAADLADGFLTSLRTGVCAHFADDRLFAHRLANQIEAYLDWAPQRAVSPPPTAGSPGCHAHACVGMSGAADGSRYFPQAQILVVREAGLQTIVSAARGGVFKHFGVGPPVTDAGLILETDTARLAASQWHDLGRQVTLTGQHPGVAAGANACESVSHGGQTGVNACESVSPGGHAGCVGLGMVRPSLISSPQPSSEGAEGADPTGRSLVLPLRTGESISAGLSLFAPRKPRSSADRKATLISASVLTFSVSGPLYWCRADLATPLTQSVLHVGMWLAGRWCRTLVRRLLQRRLITGRRPAPIRLTRTFSWLFAASRSRLPSGTTEELPGREVLPSREVLPGRQDLPAAGIDEAANSSPGTLCWVLRVTDVIELCDPQLVVRRMAFGTDHQMAYVAASGVYQDSVLHPWTDLSEKVGELNAQRRVVVERELLPTPILGDDRGTIDAAPLV